ncbi:hypothetical protein HMPREF3198_00872 [Winkia neuii]|nr:hypothetical protein HMPREF3198_00872 [Winkia neuii]
MLLLYFFINFSRFTESTCCYANSGALFQGLKAASARYITR